MSRVTSISMTEEAEQDLAALRAAWGIDGISQTVARALREARERIVPAETAAEEAMLAEYREPVMREVARACATAGEDWGALPGEIAQVVFGGDAGLAERMGDVLERRGMIERRREERIDGRGEIEYWRLGPRYQRRGRAVPS